VYFFFVFSRFVCYVCPMGRTLPKGCFRILISGPERTLMRQNLNNEVILCIVEWRLEKMVSLSIKQVSLRDRNPPLIKLTREGRVKKRRSRGDQARREGNTRTKKSSLSLKSKPFDSVYKPQILPCIETNKSSFVLFSS